MDASGNIYAVTIYDPHIYVFDNDGTLLSSVTTANNGYTGISINNKGQMVADGGSYLLFTDTSFSSLKTVAISSQSPDGSFATWIEPPLGGSSDTPLRGIVAGDSVSVDSTHVVATFASKDAGKNIAVTVAGITLSGPQARDYTLAPLVLHADIAPAPVTVTGVTANNKIYDDTTSATLNVGAAALHGVLNGDDVKLLTGNTGAFASKDVAFSIPVMASGLSLSGAQSGDYALSLPKITANISPATLTVTGVSANSKTYDGTTAAQINTVGAKLVRIFAGDNVILNPFNVVGTFARSNVGTSVPVTIMGLSAVGTQGGDYVLEPPIATANIAAAPLTITAVTDTKSFDGTTGAAALPSIVDCDRAIG